MPQRIRNMDQTTEVSWPLAKVLSVWAAFGVTTWQEAAAFAAFIYSLCLIVEWIYKRVWLNVFKRGKE